MMHDEISQRVAWLERKMVRVLWGLISLTSAGVGWLVATVTVAEHGWAWTGLFIATWLAVGFIIQRHEFKGAPPHIKFIEP